MSLEYELNQLEKRELIEILLSIDKEFGIEVSLKELVKQKKGGSLY